MSASLSAESSSPARRRFWSQQHRTATRRRRRRRAPVSGGTRSRVRFRDTNVTNTACNHCRRDGQRSAAHAATVMCTVARQPREGGTRRTAATGPQRVTTAMVAAHLIPPGHRVCRPLLRRSRASWRSTA
jgi:hypothetical protein